MKIGIYQLALCAAAFSCAACSSSSDRTPGAYVDPNIGGIAPLLTTVAPQVHRPHSMVRIYPVTEPSLTDRYLSDRIYGIALNMPRYRLGEVSSVMATAGDLAVDPRGGSSWYDHDREELHPWYHRVFLQDFGIRAEWSTTARTSVLRFVFEQHADRASNLLFRINGEGAVRILDGRTLCGWQQVEYGRQYFYARIDAPFEQAGTWTAEGVAADTTACGEHIGAWFRAWDRDRAEVRIGISYIDEEQARRNLEAESSGRSFARIVEQARQEWEDALGRIRIKGGTERERRIFYTSLYRTCERMVDQSEQGRYYSGFDRRVHEDERPFYNDDWIWDTYRNLHALQLILDPGRKADHLQSYVRMYEQWGWMPDFPELVEWRVSLPEEERRKGLREDPMIGNHTASLFAEAMRKGVEGFDLEKAYEGIRKNALEGTMIPWRSGPAQELDRFYARHGYFPALAPGQEEPYACVDHAWEKRQAVSVTLEHSYDDWCLARIADRLGYAADRELLMERSRNYLNLWNPEIGFFAPKDAEGGWIDPFDPELCDGYGARSYFAEVNAWVHLFHVQHDIPQLIELMGGPERFVERLDEAFNTGPACKWRFMGRMPDATGLQGMIPVGNEPAFHIPYLYDYAGAAWKTQHRVRQLAEQWFDDRPAGLNGDEDGGALCAWYVFTAMGFYPVNPASGEYAVGSPLFERVEIALANGKTFTVEAPGASRSRKYIRSATLDGRPLERPFITHEAIVSGATLRLEMSDTPCRLWCDDTGTN